MKNKAIRTLITWAFITIMLLALCACSTEKIPGEDGYAITLEDTVTELTVGKTATLPVPRATAPDSTDMSRSVTVEILFRDGTVFVPEHSYSLSPRFTPHLPGEYYAVYKLVVDGSTVAMTTLPLTATEEEIGEGITVDGVLDESLYSAEYRTGVDGNLSFRYYFTDKGVFIGVRVADNNLIYNDYLVARLTQSDGFEIALNFSGEESDRLNPSCRKLRVSLNGEVYVYTPSPSRSFYELNESMTAQLKHALRLHGTGSAVGKSEMTSLDIDTGYVFEAFLSYDLLAVEAPKEAMGIAFTHRDITGTAAASVILGGPGNRYYSEIVLPDGIKPVLAENGRDYEYSNYEELALTCLYNKLYITGNSTGVATPATACAANVNGIADDAIWSSAQSLDCGKIASAKVTAKAFRDANGLFVYVEVEDKDVTVPVHGDIFNGDCVRIRVAPEALHSSKKLIAGFDASGIILTLSPGGATQRSSLNPGALVYVRGFDALSFIRVTENGYCAEVFIPSYEYGGGTPGVCIGVTNGSATSYSCNENDPSTYAEIGE